MELEGRYWPGKRGSGVLRWLDLRGGPRGQTGPGGPAVTGTVVRDGVFPHGMGLGATGLETAGPPAAAPVLIAQVPGAPGPAAPVPVAPVPVAGGPRLITLHHEGVRWPVSLDWGDLETLPPAAEPLPAQRWWVRSRIVAGRTGVRHAALVVCYLAAGIALTWPRATYLAGQLPASRDVGAYVWGFWWVAHQVIHLGNPWSTSYLAAPVGTQLAYHTLMPLPGLLMTPVTLIFGPSASYNLLSIVCPGLLCYVMYRAARLWLPGRFDAVAAGALFGLSSSLAWRSWYEVNLALGALFLPMVLEASVRLRRRAEAGRRGWGRQAAVVGLLIGLAMLTDQESAVMVAVLAGLILAPWLVRRRPAVALWPVVTAAAAAAVAASPQIIAMIQQSANGGAAIPPRFLAMDYNESGAGLVQMMAPSPRLASYGLPGMASLYYDGRPSVVVIGYGAVLTLMMLTGLVVAWRRPATRLLGLLWLACTALALGSTPWVLDHGYRPLTGIWHGARVSLLMPYTWLVRVPGLANFREADRFTELGLMAAALLAGAAAGWLRARAKPVLVVLLALALMEAGWSGNPPGHMPVAVMPTALPRLDGPIAADHSRSIVVDVPFGIRGGLPVDGGAFPPETMVLATADGHPLGDAFVSRIPQATLAGIRDRAFYAGLMNAQGGPQQNTRPLLQAARRSARAMHIGWVLVWTPNTAVQRYLLKTGFRMAYEADGASVYRPAALVADATGRALLDPPRNVRSHRAHRAHRHGHHRAHRHRLPAAARLDPPRLVHPR